MLNPYSDGNLPRFTEEFKKRKNTSVTIDELGDILKVSGMTVIFSSVSFQLLLLMIKCIFICQLLLGKVHINSDKYLIVKYI